ncbi:MAG: polysaccharide deacetylase [Candidatus Nealsonbacteria bacterium]|nr:MAG: polysaccharide deacetylase [Candidatus Nealsonbacteria bacterium]
MINALSFDLEYWWCNEFLKEYLPKNKKGLIIESLNPVLSLLNKYNIKATFFVLGKVAEEYPQIIEKIHQRGHEIGSHCYSHKTLFELGKKGFEKEIKKSLRVLEKYKPIGFRAPSFSMNNSTKWAFEILKKYGFKYDSSIFPIRTKLYGVPNAPLDIYKPSKNDITKDDPKEKIIEVPLTVFNLFGKNIPIAGGFYFRIFPFWFLKRGIRKLEQKRPAILYFHPWETYPDLPKIKAPLLRRLESRWGTKSVLKKLEKLLQNFQFKPIREVLEMNHFL